MVRFSHLGYAIGVISVSGLLVGVVNYIFPQGSFANKMVIDFPFQVTKPFVCPYDLIADDSFQKYLSDTVPFANPTYVPSDLFPINSSFTANDASRFQLRDEAGIHYADMAWHFWNNFSGDKLFIFSAYRSADYQRYLLRNSCKKNQCAQAGTSEHQAGLALDLSVRTKRGTMVSLDANNKYHDRLLAHAHEFGFHNTYQKGPSVDGKIIEPRHRRYMGVELATLLHDRQQTFAEWMLSGANQISCPSLETLVLK